MKKIRILFISCILTMLFTVNVNASEQITISSSKEKLNVGDTIDLDITGTDKTPVWYSYNKNIATVNTDGVVTAIRTGKTTIRARVGYTYKTCSVNVVASSVKLNKSSATIYTGGTSKNNVKLTATVKGATKEVTWTSSNEAVATVDSTGKVTSVAPGNAVITASANNKAASCNITVKESSIALNETQMQLSTKGNGSAITLKATVVGTKKTVTWKSSDSKVATVDKNGKVTGKKSGTAVITAKANGVATNCNVNVISGLVSINKEQITLYAENPTTDTIKLKTNASTKDIVTWTSSNESVATVDNKGKVSAIGAGEAIISATCNETVDTCKVTVKQTDTSIIEDSVVLKTKGNNKTYTLNKTIVGKSTKQKWTSDNTSVVSVANGKLTAKKAGTATITLTSNGKSDTVLVTVENYDPTIKLNQSEYVLYTKKGNTYTLKATVDGPSKSVVWSSDNPEVATVSNKGKVTAVSEGQTVIRATANGISASCDIEVLESSVILSSESITLDKGEKATLGYDVTGKSQTITWKTTNNKIATVKNGVITAKGYGEADIKATANGVTSICHVKVSACEHEYESSITKEATCGDTGIETYVCLLCGDTYTETIEATGLHTFELFETNPSTCLEKGTNLFKCFVCKEEKTEEIELSDHTWGEWIEYVPATYTTEGTETRECEICKLTEDRVIPVIEHEHNYEWLTEREATCTLEGLKVHKCSICNDVDNTETIEKTEHSFGEWVITLQPTEESQGIEERICSICEYKEEGVIPAINHEHVYESVVTKPTCAEQGYTTHTCSCGDSYVDTYVDPLGHDFGEWYTYKEVDCIEDGEERQDCNRCECYNYEIILATGHEEGAGVIAKEATCTEEGKITYSCKKCNELLQEEPISKAEHDGEWVYEKEPKCYPEDPSGSRLKADIVCKNCKTVLFETTEYFPHEYEWVTTVEPICGKSHGEEDCVCKNCGRVEETRTVYAPEHTWVLNEITKEPASGVHNTLDNFGERVMECSNCHETHDAYVINIDNGNGGTQQICGYFNEQEARKTLSMVNELRESIGEKTLTWDDNIEFITKIRSVEVVYKYSHERPNGKYAYNEKGFKIFEENLASNALVDDTAGYNTDYCTAEEMFNKFYISPGHYGNMISSGAETYNCSFFVDEHGETYCIQLFTGEELYVPESNNIVSLEVEEIETEEPATEELYSVTYMNCDIVDNVEYRLQDEVTILDYVSTDDSYVFMGWSTSENSEVVEFLPNDKITITESLVLYPVYEKITVEETTSTEVQ